MMPDGPFVVGDNVMKVGGDYLFSGIVVAAFAKLSGAERYVVEDDRGVLHVYSRRNLRLAPPMAPVPGPAALANLGRELALHIDRTGVLSAARASEVFHAMSAAIETLLAESTAAADAMLAAGAEDRANG